MPLPPKELEQFINIISAAVVLGMLAPAVIFFARHKMIHGSKSNIRADDAHFIPDDRPLPLGPK